jgi:hypothetical protein
MKTKVSANSAPPAFHYNNPKDIDWRIEKGNHRYNEIQNLVYQDEPSQTRKEEPFFTPFSVSEFKGATFDQVKKYITEEDNANDLGKKLSQVMFKLQDDPKEYVKLYMDSVARDIQRGDKAQYDEMSVEDMIEDYQNYIADKSMAELKDHFGRFMKDFQ